ncbi:hypothetical protein HO173_007240 [Letharia columbiana]|uniref:Inositolphosphotransferase Aur1/Ipt1 domain-containing protein n=1 Tax=Letharia columbiana TaxID=112416 RepID=A0A8H6L3Z4_9LECA|nr:uncharacterized protein HO173_007240 [Letharia columbiana]KAF6234614.1 hypothetical protein HO173_007240 [Letharia columbiana]
MTTNLTILEVPPEWKSQPMYHLPPWGEPLIVLSILGGAMFLTRRRNFQILGKRKEGYHDSYLDSDSSNSTEDLLWYDSDHDDDSQDPLSASKHLSKRRTCCGLVISTPNSSRFSEHIHSRVLQKFPFLVEMFYWIITYLFYRLTKVFSQIIFTKSIIEVAQAHGLTILEFEQFSWASFLFPIKEHNVQHWFMQGHQDALTVLNRAYALIHIPGTVGFIAWYYYIAPSHSTFATIRRTLTLTNLFAFLTFTLYPCMPPRLLPPEYGFLDSVRHDKATSIWMSGNFVNSLAAMPSMHFGYAFVIGCTMIYHAGIFRRSLEKGETKKSCFWKSIYCLIGLGYPSMILVTIVATANHYWMDALMATIVACAAYLCNRVFLTMLPLEDLLLWVLRLEKPIPSTGDTFRQRGGRI